MRVDLAIESIKGKVFCEKCHWHSIRDYIRFSTAAGIAVLTGILIKSGEYLAIPLVILAGIVPWKIATGIGNLGPDKKPSKRTGEGDA